MCHQSLNPGQPHKPGKCPIKLLVRNLILDEMVDAWMFMITIVSMRSVQVSKNTLVEKNRQKNRGMKPIKLLVG